MKAPKLRTPLMPRWQVFEGQLSFNSISLWHGAISYFSYHTQVELRTPLPAGLCEFTEKVAIPALTTLIAFSRPQTYKSLSWKI
jgi:hypothetical protein